MRIREIDFLRGFAVLLVLFRHHPFLDITKKIGWVGVDLFFVLSGFLVSGLLFKEYQRFGNIKGGLFLIRRGFKIYPIFYLAILVTVGVGLALNLAGAAGISVEDWDVSRWYIKPDILLAEMFFYQNYYGYYWEHTWSLAVEEHFYFFLTFLIFIFIKRDLLSKARNINILFGVFAVVCLAFRIQNNITNPDYEHLTHLFHSHFRFDSLFFGVFLSWHYHFNQPRFIDFFHRNSRWLTLFVVLALSTPFIFDCRTVMMNTIGLTVLYLGFGVLLMLCLINPNTNATLDKFLTKRVVDLITRIGFYSYSIYVWHMFVQRFAMRIIHKLLPFELHFRIEFVIYFVLSVIVGSYLSKWIEMPTLAIRDKYFPRRSLSEQEKQTTSTG